MQAVLIPQFITFTLAIVALFIGKSVIASSPTLQRYSIPEPVVGGFVCAAITGLLFALFQVEVSFEMEVRDALLLYFFAGIGLKADFKTLLQGGRPLAILIGLAAGFIILQNLVGVSVASAFGLNPLAGLLSGSVSLTGGVGTTMAWAPTFVEEFGIANALELGVASNTLGLISACVIGGPIASYLIGRHKLTTGSQDELDIGTAHASDNRVTVDYFGVLRAWLWLNISLIIGYLLNAALESAGVRLPLFVSCLMAGILLGNLGRALLFRSNNPVRHGYVEDATKGLSLIQDICLGMFLTMALMSLKIWELQGNLAYLSAVIGLQVTLSVAFTVFIVFRLMGRNYEAAVICSGFGGVTLGSTATAIVNMTAVTQQYGAAHRAFIIVPLVCGFFIDIINALVINYFVYG
ncbi:glutamate:Na+ symporter, ESS family [Ferrimonas sediminum]|uniref:Sodium/glutamate symporter n=1 Tax=Ferrimonas sediminum TaxID=718193 RepID=A0A1G8WFE0_9GAMM|nr:sodium/glutamate symporter [Ferrimonas sediminum]SDJ76896.1 glutamate:Na+ symporter, ESS family [Ferrimonas sediminum]